jgi:tRNA G18 (ribose-2'-O)-methylase SpoU
MPGETDEDRGRAGPRTAEPARAGRAERGDPIEVQDSADPRIADFVGLTDIDLRRRVETERGLFMVEGLLAIERLLASPTFTPRSLLLTAKAHERLAAGLAATSTDVPVYVAPPAVLRATVGFDLHRGAIASAHRPEPADPDGLLDRARLALVLEGVNDHENLGVLFRNAAAFGVDAVILDPTCADPLYRRSVRVSLGHVLRVPFARFAVGQWPKPLRKRAEAGWDVIALTPAGDETVHGLASGAGAGPNPETGSARRTIVCVGAEGPGLSRAALAAATRRVRIPMAPGVDSINVGTAAAIALHRLAAPDGLD